MVSRAGRAKRGHGVGKTHLRQRHHVHIALSDQRVTMLTQSGACFKQAVQLAAFAKHWGFRRIQVLGLFVTEYPAAKAYALALHIADGEHHPVSKTVVSLGLTLGVFFARLPSNHQTAFNQQRVVVVRKDAGQAAPALRREAQTKSFGNLARHAAPLEVINRFGRVAQCLDVSQAGFFKHAGQGGLLLACLSCFGPVLGGHIVFGYLQAILLRQVFDGLNKRHAAVVHQKTDGVAVFAAAKAVIKLFGGADAEGR